MYLFYIYHSSNQSCISAYQFFFSNFNTKKLEKPKSEVTIQLKQLTGSKNKEPSKYPCGRLFVIFNKLDVLFSTERSEINKSYILFCEHELPCIAIKFQKIFL